MKILVTRPQPQADSWTRRLQDLGEQAASLPLIEIGPPEDEAPVRAAWRALGETRMLMFVSPNAALWFARLRPAEGGPWPAGLLAAAPGPGTCQALREALGPDGPATDRVVTPPEDCPQFDSEHLWPHLAGMPWAGQRVIIVSGGEKGQARGRQWLAGRLREAGADVQALLTYQRRAPCWSPVEQDLARQAVAVPHGHLWLLSSSQAVEHLHALLGRIPQGALALATHPRVRETALAAGFQEVHVTRPTPESVAQSRRCWLRAEG